MKMGALPSGSMMTTRVTNASPNAIQLIAPCPWVSRQPTASRALGWIRDGGQKGRSSLEAGAELRGPDRDAPRQGFARPPHDDLDRACDGRCLCPVLQRQEG